jgi:hypothetical protein
MTGLTLMSDVHDLAQTSSILSTSEKNIAKYHEAIQRQGATNIDL